ncbi:MAG: GNAT family N-acetyltransferase [Pseudomonadota bacterium]
MQITEVNAVHPDIQMLIATHKAFCEAVSPPEACHAVTTQTPEIEDFRYWLASEDGAALGCIALKRLNDDEGEVKTMHVLQTARGKGAAKALVERLLTEARAENLTRLSLETGTNAPFAASRALYARHGFAECEPFGDYSGHPFSYFMTREL